MHKFYVNGQRIEKIECDTIASDQIAFVILHFKFSKSWEGFHKVVQFTQEEYTYNLVLGTDGESCRLPSELIPGTVRMSVFGYNSDNTQALRATTVPVTLHIRPSGFIGDDPPIPPTPDLYAQLLKKIDDKLAAIDGINGVNGKDGKDGVDGKDGANGLSAYELALQKGYSGTLDEWLLSLKGADGKEGINGIDGVNGKDGVNGADGINGKDGQDGKNGADGLSAYELAVQKGYSGTLDDWLLSLKGADGKDGTNGKDGVNGADGKDGVNGADGKDGINGRDGINGKDGQDGKNGTDGLSAYELAVQKGYSGTLDDWLLSLKGADGKDGINGIDGVNGKDGVNGTDGINGKDGQDGKNGADGLSAYELAVQKGYSGTLYEWLLSLKGADGKDGINGIDGVNGKDGVNGIDGINGKDGQDGKNGADGLSAYELAVQKGYSGTLDAWLLSLNGADGKDGTNGRDGVNGTDGKDGINGRDGVDGKNGLSAYELAVQKGYSGTLDEWLLSLKGADGNSNGASYDYVNGRIDDIQNINQKRLAELSEAFHNRMVEIETRMSLLETELLSKSGSVNEKALFTNTVDVWDVFDTTIEVLFDDQTYSLISFTERYPDFCSENTDHMLNYSYSVFGWGVSVMTAYALEVSINSRSKILMEYKAGSRQSSCFYLVSPEGRGSNTPIADFLFDRIKAGNCITIPFEWLLSENFISTITYCTDVPDGKYYVAWTGISDNTHPLIKTIKVLGG